jgi:hypothetical protein
MAPGAPAPTTEETHPMDLTRTRVRALVAACAVALLVTAACGDDDDSADTGDDTEQSTESTDAESTESTEAEEETTASEPEEETTTSEAEEEGNPEAVATAEAINLTIDDFAEGWVEEEDSSEENGEDDFDQCFTTIDLASVTLGEAESPTFSAELPDGQSGQVVGMKTVVFDTPESATAALTELATQDFANCTQSGITGSEVEGVQASLTAYGDEPPISEQSVGVAGSIQIPGEDGEDQQGRLDLHAIRTGNIASFTLTLDIGETPSTAFEQTLTELYTVIAERQAAEAG